MHKDLQIIMKIICLFFLVAFTFGCDSQTEPPQAPKVITQKIAVSPPVQPAPAKSPVPTPPATKQPSEPIQQPTTSPAKPETTSKAIPPAPVAEKPQAAPAPEIKMAAAQPPATQTQPTAVLPEKGATVPSPLGPPIEKGSDKPLGDIPPDAQKTVETSPQDSGSASAGTGRMSDTAGIYRPAGKVDPFLPLFEEKPAAPDESADAEKKKKKRRMPLTPLERVDLSQLKLVGIIQAPNENKALVEEASGKGYIIKKGTFIGIHAGRVLEIQKDRVIVEEEVENVLGQYTLEKKELKLQKPPGEF